MLTIMLIEDDELVRYSLTAALENAEMEVRAYEDGSVVDDDEAFQDVDVVVTDIIMPQRDGIEVVTNLRLQRPDLPVIAISGGGRISGRHYTDTAQALGANAVFTKPLDERVLIEKINELAA